MALPSGGFIVPARRPRILGMRIMKNSFSRQQGMRLALLLAACVAQAAVPVTAAQGQQAPSYKLSAGETLKITTFGEQSLTGDFAIGTDGVLAFPLIGSIKAAGLTPEQLEAAIRTRLGDGFLVDPKVNVEVKSFKPVYILGEVNKPGEYAYMPGMTVHAVVAKAEGFTYRAQQKRVFIKRAGEAAEKEVALSSQTAIFPGDTVRIAERYF